MTDMETQPTILIVDDEPAILLGLSAIIRRQGYAVVTADNGGDGILKAKESRPDLIVSDVMMPEMSGFDMKRIMGDDPALADIPFIFLTARSTSDDRVMGIRSGADDYVTKPFVTDELLARIEAVLRRVKTERERGHRQAQQAAQEELDNLRDQLMKNFRHELRTPLSNVMMALELAVNRKFTSLEEQTEFIRIAYSSGDRLESLVSDIILLTDMDQKNLNTVRQAIDVETHILAPIQKRLARYWEKELNFVPQIAVKGTIMAPRREFAQALVHLADNAFKFSPEHGEVAFALTSEGNGGASITVQDQGMGIPPDLREKFFERFFQASGGDNREQQGLGVGLTVARAVFRSLGGDVILLNCEKGCRVQATLPDLRPEDVTFG